MSYKLRVSKAGYNVLTETNLDNIVYDSNYDTLKYYVSGSVDLVVSGSDAVTSITHNLGYIPFFTAYINFFTNDYQMCPVVYADIGDYAFVNVYADTTKIYFKILTNAFSDTYTFKYKVFRNNTGL